MSSAAASLEDRYIEALEEHLAGGGEWALSRAWQLGREALAEGLGVLELTAIHLRAVERAGPVEPERLWERIGHAGLFLLEALSPFEMALRGYKDANQSLRTLNASLEHANLELSTAKAEIEIANRELEAFSYSVAHDLRAPLRSIDGFSQALLEDAPGLGERAKDHLTRVRGAARRMGELIDDLLRMAKLGRAELRRQEVDVTALALEISAELKRADPARQAQFEIQPGLTAWADPRLLRVVLENLLGNAWKFTQKTVPASIKLGGDAGGFFIRDNGVGFDPANVGRLFTPFQRLHSEREFPGSGIGLATVARVVARHGGRAWAEGAPGEGATFRWTLPPPAPVGPAAPP